MHGTSPLSLPLSSLQHQLAGVIGLSCYLPLHEEGPVVSGKGCQPNYTALTCPAMRLAAHLRLHCLPFCQPSIVTPCTRPAVSMPSAWRAPLGLVAASVCAAEHNKGTPVLMCHGDADQVVDYSFGKRRCSGWVGGLAGWQAWAAA